MTKDKIAVAIKPLYNAPIIFLLGPKRTKKVPTILAITHTPAIDNGNIIILIEEKKIVQPVYISDKNLDNIESKRTKRHYHIQEFDAMNKIKQKIFRQFPLTKDLLLPTIEIKKVKIDSEIMENMKELH